MQTFARITLGMLLGVLSSASDVSGQPVVAEAVNGEEKLPTPEEIMARAVNAMGGVATIGNISTLYIVAESTFEGKVAQTDQKWLRKGARVYKSETADGISESGFDGTTSWVRDARGCHIPSGMTVEEHKNHLGVFMGVLETQLQTEREMARIQSKGTQIFAGKNCYQLHGALNRGGECEMYFAVDSGLLVGKVFRGNDAGRDERQTIYSDWKPVGGVQIFHTMTVESLDKPGAVWTLTVTKAEVNTLDETDFAAPDEVQKLIADHAALTARAIHIEELTVEQREQVRRLLQAYMQNGNVDFMKRMVTQHERFLDHVSSNPMLLDRYVVQELKKEIDRLTQP